jgi:hypothetical protein
MKEEEKWRAKLKKKTYLKTMSYVVAHMMATGGLHDC